MASYACLVFLAVLWAPPTEAARCADLLMGQYRCDISFVQLQHYSQLNCATPCRPISGITCDNRVFNGSEVGFYRTVDCKKKSANYKLVVILSVFGGMFGLDRFYLGYPGLGLLKLLSFGGMGFWHLVDIILISLQILGPSDGSHYQTFDIASRLLDNETHYFYEL